MGKKKASQGQDVSNDSSKRNSGSIAVRPESHRAEQGLSAHSKEPGDEPSVLPRSTESDDFVWELPGFDKAGFYAAADYLRTLEQNQDLPRAAEHTYSRTNIENSLSTRQLGEYEQLVKDVLDNLALLFANAKKTDSLPADRNTAAENKHNIAENKYTPIKNKVIPAKHVTATALKVNGIDLEIWIAKNDGPTTEDEDFRSKLEMWFNRKGVWNKKAALMTAEINDFWRQRLHYYRVEIKKAWKVLGNGPKPNIEGDSSGRAEVKVAQSGNKAEAEVVGLGKSYDILRKIYQDEMIKLDLFEEDWRKAKLICSSLKSSDAIVPSDSIGPEFYDVFDLEEPKSHLELARTFTKLLKAIKLLGTVEKAVHIFTEFREKIVRSQNIHLSFLNPPKSLDLSQDDRTAIAERLKSWIRPHRQKFVSPEFKTEIEERVQAFEDRADQKERTSHRFFHCELQLLDKFLEDGNTYDYFGCSKLSCFICYEVLKGTRFRTRDTHARLYAPCAFPFSAPRAKGNSRYDLLLALKKVQDHVLERVLHRELDKEFEFSANQSLAETEPGGEMMNRRRPRTFERPGDFGSVLKFAKIRSIRIPVDGEPVLKSVLFRIRPHDEGHLRCTLEDLTKDGIAPAIWMGNGPVTQKTDLKVQEVYSERRGRDIVSIFVCANRGIHQSSTPGHIVIALEPVNTWYKNLIQDFYNYSYDPFDRTCDWRGDLYIYRTITSYGIEYIDSYGDGPKPVMRETTELDTIAKPETSEVIQKCRDVLKGTWVCFFVTFSHPIIQECSFPSYLVTDYDHRIDVQPGRPWQKQDPKIPVSRLMPPYTLIPC